MSLLKEISAFNEAAAGEFKDTRVQYFVKNTSRVRNDIDALNKYFKSDSSLKKSIQELNGDVSWFDSAVKAFGDFEDAFDEMIQYTVMGAKMEAEREAEKAGK